MAVADSSEGIAWMDAKMWMSLNFIVHNGIYIQMIIRIVLLVFTEEWKNLCRRKMHEGKNWNDQWLRDTSVETRRSACQPLIIHSLSLFLCTQLVASHKQITINWRTIITWKASNASFCEWLRFCSHVFASCAQHENMDASSPPVSHISMNSLHWFYKYSTDIFLSSIIIYTPAHRLWQYVRAHQQIRWLCYEGNIVCVCLLLHILMMRICVDSIWIREVPLSIIRVMKLLCMPKATICIYRICIFAPTSDSLFKCSLKLINTRHFIFIQGVTYTCSRVWSILYGEYIFIDVIAGQSSYQTKIANDMVLTLMLNLRSLERRMCGLMTPHIISSLMP